MRFYFYNGLAGDFHVLLVGVKDGVKVSCLYNRAMPFKLFRLKVLKRRLIAEHELLTAF